MQLFRLHASAELLDEYLRENYISIDLPWLVEDVEFVQWEQLCASYEQAASCAELRLFVYDMQDEDLMIVTDGERAYLGDMGDYYFVESVPDEQEVQAVLPPCLHRRGVTWLKPVDLNSTMMSERLKLFLSGIKLLDKFEQAVSIEECESMLTGSFDRCASNSGGSRGLLIDVDTIQEAIAVLKQALSCEDAKRRERAAIALLAFAQGERQN